MLKGNRKYIFFLVICLSVLILLQIITPKPINWNLSYMKKDKNPYGTSALYELLPFVFPHSKIEDAKVPLYNSLNNAHLKNTNYIIINDQFDPDKLDVRELLNFVKQGNSVFISANYISERLADTLKLETTIFFDNVLIVKDTSYNEENQGWQQKSTINFYNPLLKYPGGYVARVMESTYFSSFDTTAVTVLGNANGKKVNFIKMPFGKGNLFLHTTPEIFINYNFLDENRSDYAAKALSYLPVQNILWDEYYKSGKVAENNNSLRVLLSHKALSTAYFVLMFSILLFIVLGIKRKQRIIPVIEPLRNTTLDFVNTIGTLYYQQGSHKEIADKQINYFLAFLRSSFRLTTTVYDDIFITKLSERSGIERDKIKGLMNYISYLKIKPQIHEQELLQLNSMIEDFYKLNKR